MQEILTAIVVILFHLTAVALVFRLFLTTGRSVAWFLIAAGLVLSALQHTVTLVRHIAGQESFQLDLASELVFLTVFGLIAIGLALFVPFSEFVTKSLVNYKTVAKQDQQVHKLIHLACQGMGVAYLTNAAVESLGTTLNLTRCCLLEFRKDPNRFKVMANYKDVKSQTVPKETTIEFIPDSIEAQSLATGTVTFVENKAEHEQFSRKSFGFDETILSTYCFPFRCSGGYRGVFILQSKREMALDENGVSFAQNISRSMNSLLSVRQSELEIKRQNEDLREQLDQTNQDLTELQKTHEKTCIKTTSLERALELERYNAKQISRTKTALLSNTSRAFRIPLNTILGFTRVLENDPVEPLSDLQQESVKEIIRATELLRERVDSWVDLARIESRHVKLHIEKFNLGELIQSCVSTLRYLPDNQMGIQIIMGPKNLDMDISTDRSLMRMLIVNTFLTVACRELKENQITLKVTKRARSELQIEIVGRNLPDYQYRKQVIDENIERIKADESILEPDFVHLAVAHLSANLIGNGISVDIPDKRSLRVLISVNLHSTDQEYPN